MKRSHQNEQKDVKKRKKDQNKTFLDYCTHIIYEVIKYLTFRDVVICSCLNKTWNRTCLDMPIDTTIDTQYYEWCEEIRESYITSINKFKTEGSRVVFVLRRIEYAEDRESYVICSDSLEQLEVETVEIDVNISCDRPQTIKTNYPFTINKLNSSIKNLKIRGAELYHQFWTKLAKQSVEKLVLEDCVYANGRLKTVPSLKYYELKTKYVLSNADDLIFEAVGYPPLQGQVKQIKVHIFCNEWSWWPDHDFGAIESVDEIDYYCIVDFEGHTGYLSEMVNEMNPKSIITPCSMKNFDIVKNSNIKNLTLVLPTISLADGSDFSELVQLETLSLKFVDTSIEYPGFDEKNVRSKNKVFDLTETIPDNLPKGLKMINIIDEKSTLGREKWKKFICKIPQDIHLYYNNKMLDYTEQQMI